MAEINEPYVQVDQAVSMAFGGSGNGSKYVRIQGTPNVKPNSESDAVMSVTKEMLGQRNVESHLFKGKKRSEVTNLEKLEMMGGELIKEQERRKTGILPTVVLKQKQSAATPRTSSASATTISSTPSSWSLDHQN